MNSRGADITAATILAALCTVVILAMATPAGASPVQCDSAQALYLTPDEKGCEVRTNVNVDKEWIPVGVLAMSAVIVPLVALAIGQVRR